MADSLNYFFRETTLKEAKPFLTFHSTEKLLCHADDAAKDVHLFLFYPPDSAHNPNGLPCSTSQKSNHVAARNQRFTFILLYYFQSKPRDKSDAPAFYLPSVVYYWE